MNKKLRPKWYEESMMTDAQVMKKDKAMFAGECLDDEMEEEHMEMATMMGEQAEPGMMMLAHAYVPWQCYDRAFSPREALMRGTLFPELWGVYPIPE